MRLELPDRWSVDDQSIYCLRELALKLPFEQTLSLFLTLDNIIKGQERNYTHYDRLLHIVAAHYVSLRQHDNALQITQRLTSFIYQNKIKLEEIDKSKVLLRMELQQIVLNCLEDFARAKLPQQKTLGICQAVLTSLNIISQHDGAMPKTQHTHCLCLIFYFSAIAESGDRRH